MTRLLRAALLLGALVPAPALAQIAAPAAVQPIAFTERTLANGLRVYAIRDTSTPNVAVQVWYDVGSKDDPKGRSGFAHLFEHLMFKATRNLASEQFDRLTEDVGGYNNASTGDDYTNYLEMVPANHLERILFAEADRMASLVVDPAGFASERDVVKEEYRARVLAQPYGTLLSLYYPQVAYAVHPYARPGIGSLADLDAASIDDVRAFHATYYRPDNAVLMVSGNFEAAQLDAWIDRYFAGIARPAAPIPRVTAVEPPRTRATQVTVYAPNTPLPAVLVSYHLPPDNDPDIPALTVLQAILSTGESSRMYESIVYRDQIATAAEAFLDTKKATGNLVAYAILAGGKTAAEGEAALKRTIASMRDRPATAAELAEARNEIVTSAIRSRETAEGRASTIASSVLVDGDPRAADRQLAAIQRVTAADVQRVARKYLNDTQSATIRYLPAEAKTASSPGDTIALAPTVSVAPLAVPAGIAVVTPAPEGRRVLPPPVGPAVATALPIPVEIRLTNGLRVVTVEKKGLPIVSASLVAVGGAATDPSGRAGTASLAAGLLTKGTKTRSATEIARAMEALGGSIGSGVERDGAAISVTIGTAALAPALAIMADVATGPAFAPDEVERARTQAIDGVTVSLKDPAELASLVADRAVFGGAPYGSPVTGTSTSLKAITRADLTASYATTWRPDRAALILVGDISPADAKALAERMFGAWRASPAVSSAPASASASASAPAYPAPRVIIVDLPDAGQAGVVIARPAIARDDPGFHAAALANTVLGGGYSSRLNQEVRIRRGLAYGASSGLSANRSGGSVAAGTQTKNASAPEVVALIVAEMKRLGRDPAPAASEVDTRKAVLIGNFGRAIERTSGVSAILGSYVIDGVPLDEFATYVPAIQGISPATVRAAAARLLDPVAASIVVVGDAQQFEAGLRKAYPKVEVIPAAALNLDKPALK